MMKGIPCQNDSLWVQNLSQDDEKGGLGLRGVAVTTEAATTTETAKTVKTVTVASWYCIL